MATEPHAALMDCEGKQISVGDRVRVVGMPDLTGMSEPYRSESLAVFSHIVGTRKRVTGFDELGHAELCFSIRHGAHAGMHIVGIEPYLLRLQLGPAGGCAAGVR